MTAFARCLLMCWIPFAVAQAAAPPLVVDGDGDGISDEVDDCPYTPPGIRVDALGCPRDKADGDLDGVPDVADECPYTPAGAQVGIKGCAIDDDFDGVANGLDRCPRSRLGEAVDELGCTQGERPGPVTAVPPPSARPPRVQPPSMPAPVAAAPAPVIAKPLPLPPPRSTSGLAAPSPSPATPKPSPRAGKESEKPKLVIGFNVDGARLGEGDLQAIRGYARIFSRQLAASPTAIVSLKAYADEGELSRDRSVAVARMTAVRKVLVQNGIAADRIRSESAPLALDKSGKSRRVEAEVISR